MWLTSVISILATYATTYWVIGDMADGLWWKLSTIISCGTLAGALIPELVKVFTSTTSRHVREVVKSSREGGASLNILSGLVAGNFSGYWLGITIVGLMGGAFLICQPRARRLHARARRCSRSAWSRSGSSAWAR